MNLSIKIHLEGDVNEIIKEYDYSVNTNPKSKSKIIHIPLTALIGNKDAFKNSAYPKNPIEIFFTTDRLTKFLTNRSNLFKHMSTATYEDLTSIKNEIKIKEQEYIYDNSSETKKIIEDLETKATNIKQSINKSNIDLILTLIFKKDNVFYFKNKKYKINSNTRDNIKYEITDNMIEDLPTYQELLNDLIQEQKKKLYNISLQQFLYTLHKTPQKIENDEIRELYTKDSSKLTPNEIIEKKDLVNKQKKVIEETAAKDAIAQITEPNFAQKINNYALKIVNKLNDYAKKQKTNVQYKYVNNIGIKVIKNNLTTMHITIKLNIIDIKTIEKSNFIYNCKTRKKKIKSIYNELFEVKILPELKLKDKIDNDYIGYKLFYKEKLNKYKNEKSKNKKIKDFDIQDIYTEWNKLSKNKQEDYIIKAKKDPSISKVSSSDKQNITKKYKQLFTDNENENIFINNTDNIDTADKKKRDEMMKLLFGANK